MKEKNIALNSNHSNVRTEWLDSLRAFAILLVVAGHVAELWDNKFMMYLYQGLYLFHMPLFFVMSGITFEWFTLRSNNSLRKIWVKRVVNLLVPAFSFTVIQILFDARKDIFSVYSGIWFLIFLALILSVEIFAAMCENTGKRKIKNLGGGYLYTNFVRSMAALRDNMHYA